VAKYPGAASANPSAPPTIEEIHSVALLGLQHSGPVVDLSLLLKVGQLKLKLGQHESGLVFAEKASVQCAEMIFKETGLALDSSTEYYRTRIMVRLPFLLCMLCLKLILFLQAYIDLLRAELFSTLNMYKESEQAFERASKYQHLLVPSASIVNSVRGLLKLPLTQKSLSDAKNRCEWALGRAPGVEYAPNIMPS